MRLQLKTIKLGTHQWQVRPLTIAQVQVIEPLLFDQTDGATVEAAIGVLRVALARDHAEAATKLEAIEAGAPEIAAAMATVLRLGGFLPAEDTAWGEGLEGNGLEGKGLEGEGLEGEGLAGEGLAGKDGAD